jgi:hypothetical protein
MSKKRCGDSKVLGLQLEKRVRDLQHEDVGMTMVVHDEDAFHGPPHSKVFIIILQALETSRYGGVLLGLCLLGARARDGWSRLADEVQSVT